MLGKSRNMRRKPENSVAAPVPTAPAMTSCSIDGFDCRLKESRMCDTNSQERGDGKALAPQPYLKAKQALLEDIESSSIVRLTDRVVARAVEILERWPLRSSDSLHVACAAEWSADLFVSADAKQCQAARAYGLRVEALPSS